MQNFVKNIQKCMFSTYNGQAKGQGRCRKSHIRRIIQKKSVAQMSDTPRNYQ